MTVVEGVENHPAIAARADDAGAAEQPQLVRDGRAAHAQPFGDVADAELALSEGVEDADAGGIAEDAEDVGEAVDVAWVNR